MQKEILTSIEKNLDTAWKLNLLLAQNPELAGEEKLASKTLVEILQDAGARVKTHIAGLETAFMGQLRASASENKIGIIFEYDALEGLGHGCGHCASAAISLLSSLVILENPDVFDANIYAIGTPGEELKGLKAQMASAGVFDGFDMVIMVHMHKENRINCRFLAYKNLYFNFYGKKAHAGESPWLGNNALNGLRLMANAFDMMRQKLKDESKIEGIFLDAGIAPNIIPDYARAKYGFRAKEAGYLEGDFTRIIEDAAKGAAIATQTRVEIEKASTTFYDLIQSPTALKLMEEVYEDLGIKHSDFSPYLGSSDIGNVSYVCPAIHPTVSIGKNYSLHTKEFAQAMKEPETKDAIKRGAMVILSYIGKIQGQKALLEKIGKEFKEKR